MIAEHFGTKEKLVNAPKSTKGAGPSLSRAGPHVARNYLSTRWILLALASLIVVIGAALNWSWLVAIGIAPILLALAPCAVMCALGLCAMKMGRGSK